MNKEDIKKRILDALGNPSSGAIVDHLDTIVEAIVGRDQKSGYKPNAKDGDGDGLVQDGTAHERPAKETRIIQASEKRR